MCGTAKKVEKEVQNVGKGIETGIQNVGKNIETNFQNVGKDVQAIASGNFNNLGQSLLNQFVTGTTLGVINPDTQAKMTGETTSARMKSEAEAQAITDQQAAVAAEKQDQENQIAAMLQGITGAKRRSPGRAQTLLMVQPSGTLLSPMGS